MTTMQAAGAYQHIIALSGTQYVSDVNSHIFNVSGGDVLDLIKAGCAVLTVLNNVSASTDPTTTSDSAAGYQVGSTWFNSTSSVQWKCLDATASAAIWVPIEANFIGRLIGANMNVTTDQAIPLFIPATKTFLVRKIAVKNASISLTTAVGGVYPAASKGGTPLVANTQVYSSLSAATKEVDLTMAVTTTVQAAATPLYLSLTTAQGAAATADVYVYGDIYA